MINCPCGCKDPNHYPEVTEMRIKLQVANQRIQALEQVAEKRLGMLRDTESFLADPRAGEAVKPLVAEIQSHFIEASLGEKDD